MGTVFILFLGIVNWLLSGSLMQIGAKLSYSVYLVHFVVLDHRYGITRTKLSFSDFNMVSINLSILINNNLL